MIGGASLVRYGIMPNYTDYPKAMDYFKKKEMLSRIRSPLGQSKKDLRSKNDRHAKKGVVTEVPFQDLFMDKPTHLVPKANGDMRLEMDMTKVNRFMKRIKFKMEGVSTLSELFSKNDYAISFNLKDAYNHVQACVLF
jgi:hypothetical protein